MALKIYFAGSIRAGRNDVPLYVRIVEVLKTYGTVLTEHVADPSLEEGHLSDKEIHDRDMKWLATVDVLVAEVTQPSLGVGYEIGRAIEMDKKILCLFRPDCGRRLSAMIRGAENGTSFKVIDYKDEDVERIVHEYFSS